MTDLSCTHLSHFAYMHEHALHCHKLIAKCGPMGESSKEALPCLRPCLSTSLSCALPCLLAPLCTGQTNSDDHRPPRAMQHGLCRSSIDKANTSDGYVSVQHAARAQWINQSACCLSTVSQTLSMLPEHLGLKQSQSNIQGAAENKGNHALSMLPYYWGSYSTLAKQNKLRMSVSQRH